MRGGRTIVLAALISLFSVATIHAQPSSDSASCLPLAVATAPQTPGQPLTSNDIVLTSVEGTEIARAEFAEPLQVIPTTYPARSVVRSLGGDFGILAMNVDGSAAGVVMPLTEFEDSIAIQYGGPGFEVPDGSRFGLFHDAATLRAYVVDLDSGSTLPLSAFADDTDRIVSAEVASGDERLAVWTGRDIVLFDIGAGPATESLGGGETLGFPSFSDDGSTLYFQRRGADDESLIVARDVVSGVETPLTVIGEWFGLQHFAGDILVAQTPGALHRIPTDGSGAIALVESSAELRPRMIDPAGQNLLVESSTPDAVGWLLVDVSGLGATELPGLAGLSLTSADEQARWALLLPHLGPQPGVAGAAYVSLDLETGETRSVLAQQADGIYFADSPRTDDGRFVVIWSLSPAVGKLWLIDNELGHSELIAESTGSAVGALTSDGCYLAVGIFDTVGEGRQGIVQVIDLETRQVTTEIPDAILLGWART